MIPPAAADERLNRPDRGEYRDTDGCTMPEWNYDAAKDQNAGGMVKAVVIIRINPLPAGYEAFDVANGGWAMIDARQILIYGHGVTATASSPGR